MSARPRRRRAKLVRLTARGSAAAAAGARIIAGIEHDWSERLGARTAQQLRRTLEQLHEVVRPD